MKKAQRIDFVEKIMKQTNGIKYSGLGAFFFVINKNEDIRDDVCIEFFNATKKSCYKINLYSINGIDESTIEYAEELLISYKLKESIILEAESEQKIIKNN